MCRTAHSLTHSALEKPLGSMLPRLLTGYAGAASAVKDKGKGTEAKTMKRKGIHKGRKGKEG